MYQNSLKLAVPIKECGGTAVELVLFICLFTMLILISPVSQSRCSLLTYRSQDKPELLFF